MICVFMVSIVMTSVNMLNVVTLNVIMLCVVVPLQFTIEINYLLLVFENIFSNLPKYQGWYSQNNLRTSYD
jgi:hypothetical protein